FDGPRLDEACAQEAARLHEEGTGTHRRIADPQVEELFGRLQLPLGARRSLRGAVVDDGRERLLDDALGEALGRVVRAGLATVGAEYDDECALRMDQRVAPRIGAKQPDVGLE